jgi:outer membrane protein W
MKKISFLMLVFAVMLPAQQTDSTIVFESPNMNIVTPIQKDRVDAWGVDILLSNNGFGLAGFYRREFSRDLFGTVTLGIAESKDDNEVEYVTYWGQTIVPGKINRFLLIPLHLGVQYRLFADDITDSFRPYVNAGIGPTLVLSAPFDKEYFNSWGSARSHYTLGGYVGAGAFFGADMGTLSGINIRYYFIPFGNGITSMMGPIDPVDPNKPREIFKKKDFGGFFITINLGSAF